MAFIHLYTERLAHNFEYLDKLFKENKISWGVVTKVLCGSKVFLKEVLKLDTKEMHDTRISNLKEIKKLNPQIQTVYIKPPAKRSIANVVKYADVSFNTDLDTINLLSTEATKQKKIHKIIIMIEMGDLREGVMGDEFIDFYEQVFHLPHIEIIGIGTNLNCLNGILPNQDKLIQLSLYKQLIEIKFNQKIKWISGGTSVTLSLLRRKLIPKGVNHFRVGEVLFFGNDLITGKQIKGMKSDVFRLYTEIIELYEKPVVPNGEQGENVQGETPEFNANDYGRTTYRAIIDIGLLDINPEYLIPADKAVEIIEASSDMIVLDLGKNKNKYKTGDIVSFNLRYMGALALMNSDYIDKIVK